MTRIRNVSGPSANAVGFVIGGRAGGAAGRDSWRPSGAFLGRRVNAPHSIQSDKHAVLFGYHLWLCLGAVLAYNRG